MTSIITNDTPLHELPVVSLDLETTGLDVRKDRIVQVAVIEVSANKQNTTTIIDSLVDPGIPISPKSTGIHGISNADVAGAPSFFEIKNAIQDAIDNHAVIGHHIGFDLAVLRHESVRANLNWHTPSSLDLALLAAAIAPELPDHSLESVAKWLDVPVSGRHTALGDSQIAAAIFMKLLPVVQAREMHTLGDAKKLASLRNDLIKQELRAGWHQDSWHRTHSGKSEFEEQVSELREIKNAQADQARKDLDDGVPATDIQAHISSINIDLHSSVIDLCIREVVEQYLGEPPVAFEAIIIGSGARYESLLFPDQDNGFILADHADTDSAAIDQWFESAATCMTDTLADIGFYRCPGWVMATNPRWRKSLTDFKQQTSQWIAKARGDDLHYCNIFLDFRSFYGTGELAESLHEFVVEHARNQRFLSRLCEIHKNHTGSLGWFGRIITDPNPGPNHGKIDLKTGGTLPIVTAVRLLSLYYGIRGGTRTTRERIELLNSLGLLDEADKLLAAYSHIVFLLLRQQLEDHRNGTPIGNYLPPQALSKNERAQLIGAFKEIRRICKQVAKTVRKPITPIAN